MLLIHASKHTKSTLMCVYTYLHTRHLKRLFGTLDYGLRSPDKGLDVCFPHLRGLAVDSLANRPGATRFRVSGLGSSAEGFGVQGFGFKAGHWASHLGMLHSGFDLRRGLEALFLYDS